jgi:hypothetical protein
MHARLDRSERAALDGRDLFQAEILDLREHEGRVERVGKPGERTSDAGDGFGAFVQLGRPVTVRACVRRAVRGRDLALMTGPRALVRRRNPKSGRW